MKKIGILSDTHGLLRPEILEILAGCDVIFHGGDINRPEIVEELQKIAPLYVVRGNNDKEWAEAIPHFRGYDKDCNDERYDCGFSPHPFMEIRLAAFARQLDAVVL